MLGGAQPDILPSMGRRGAAKILGAGIGFAFVCAAACTYSVGDVNSPTADAASFDAGPDVTFDVTSEGEVGSLQQPETSLGDVRGDVKGDLNT